MSDYTARGRQKGTGFENVADSLSPDGPLADGPVEYQPAEEGLVADGPLVDECLADGLDEDGSIGYGPTADGLEREVDRYHL